MITDAFMFGGKCWRALERHPRPLRFLSGKALMKSGLSKWIALQQRGFRLRFYPSALSMAFWMDRRDREEDERFLRAFLRSGDVVIDVGANIGHLALVAATRVGGVGAVYAFEPSPRIFSYLEGNLALNGVQNVRAFCAAVGDAEGMLRFVDGCMDDGNKIVTDGGISVPVRRLDDCGIADAVISVLKVDVEGYELFVLRGSDNILRRTRCVMFESWEQHFSRYGYTSGDVRRLLVEHGFRIYRREAQQLVGVDVVSHDSESIEEFVALREGEEERLRDHYPVVPLQQI